MAGLLKSVAGWLRRPRKAETDVRPPPARPAAIEPHPSLTPIPAGASGFMLREPAVPSEPLVRSEPRVRTEPDLPELNS